MKLKIVSDRMEKFREEFGEEAQRAFAHLANDPHFRMIAGLDTPRWNDNVGHFVEAIAPTKPHHDH